MGKSSILSCLASLRLGLFWFATRLLQQWRKDEYCINAPPETVYFVGDTLESDIKDTNQFNTKSKNDWHSILVRTGVYQEGTQPVRRPMATVDTVLNAVNLGLKIEFNKKIKK
jgi:ribonucleotide monophosphatase NagD (HAD superfamily)